MQTPYLQSQWVIFYCFNLYWTDSLTFIRHFFRPARNGNRKVPENRAKVVTAKTNDTFHNYNRKVSLVQHLFLETSLCRHWHIPEGVWLCYNNFIWKLYLDAVHSCWAYQNASSRLDDDEYDQDLEEPTIKSVTEAMASGEMLRHFAQFHGYQLALTLCKVNDLLSEIKLSGPQRHMDDYFLKWTVNCYSFHCISRAYLLLLPVLYFNKMWIWPNPKFRRPVLSGHPVLNRHLAIPLGCLLNTGLIVIYQCIVRKFSW